MTNELWDRDSKIFWNIRKYSIFFTYRVRNIIFLVSWLFLLFFGTSVVFGSFNAELSKLDKSLYVSRSSYLQTCIRTVFVYTQWNVKAVPFQTIQFSISTELNAKTVLFQATQFDISTQFSSIWPIDRTQSDATTPGQSEPESDYNNELLRIPQSSSITGTSSSDCLVPYPGDSLWGALPIYRDLVYSAVLVEWTNNLFALIPGNVDPLVLYFYLFDKLKMNNNSCK